MTNRYTHDEWLAIIDRAKDCFQSISVDYKAPSIGTEAFAKSIDHTLLKLDATKEHIDKLCEEARRHNFKVRFPIDPIFLILICMLTGTLVRVRTLGMD